MLDCDLLAYFPGRQRSQSHLPGSSTAIWCICINKSLAWNLQAGTPILPLVVTILFPFSEEWHYCLGWSAFSPALFMPPCPCSPAHLHIPGRQLRQGGGGTPKCNVSLTFEKMLTLTLTKKIHIKTTTRNNFSSHQIGKTRSLMTYEVEGNLGF